jgi:hypothetical protein
MVQSALCVQYPALLPSVSSANQFREQTGGAFARQSRTNGENIGFRCSLLRHAYFTVANGAC